MNSYKGSVQAFSPCYLISWSETTLDSYIFFLPKIACSELIFQVFFQAVDLVLLSQSSSPQRGLRQGLSNLAFSFREKETAVEFLLALKFFTFVPVVGMNPRVFGGDVEAAPPQLTREAAVSDGGLWYEHPQLVRAWVEGEEVDKPPQ